MATRRTIGILVVLAAPVAILAWWLGSPLFLDRTVDEDFPIDARATIPDSITQGEVEQVAAGLADQMDEIAEPMPDGDAPEALRRGQFVDADNSHRGVGRATVYRLANGDHLLRFEEFRVTNGPDLRVLLTSHAGPTSHADLDAAGYVELGQLKGNVGDQDYPIPNDVDIAGQRSVVIYCRPFQVEFSVTRLATVDQ